MTPEQAAVADLAALLVAAVLVGAAASGRLWLCRSFGFYLVYTLATNRLVSWWPEHFFTWRFWTMKETLQAVLVVAVAVELARAAFAPFPRARRLAVVGVLSVATLAWLGAGAAAAVAGGGTPPAASVARAVLGAVWAMAVVVAVAYRYRLPLSPWHRLLALGFTLYYGLYALLLGALEQFGSPAHRYAAALDPAAYAATAGLWLSGCWQASWREVWSRARGWLRGEQYP